MAGTPRAQEAGGSSNLQVTLRRLFSQYGMVLVLAGICAFFSWATFHPESPLGVEGAQSLAGDVAALRPPTTRIAIVVSSDDDSRAFASELSQALQRSGPPPTTIAGDPPTVRQALEAEAAAGRAPDLIATTQACRSWAVWDALRKTVPAYAHLRVLAPTARYRSAFLSPSNLRNVTDQISVIAIIAAAMTMVIILGGIDLSVGSLIALAAVCTAWMIRRFGGEGASSGSMLIACLAAIAVCGAVGLFSGAMVTMFRTPPFIATLAMMQVAGGLAFIVAQGQSIYDIPGSFTWLGRSEFASMPVSVLLMAAIYIGSHLVMARSRFGRMIYAVGGNAEAARLSGIPISRVKMLVYGLSGTMAGVGGVITASQLKAGSPTFGGAYELYVIAAVVVGGTSLAGGEGQIFGTLIGALIIGVIRNGMNLMNVEPYTQKVMLGLVILGAVLLDMWKRRRVAS